MSSRLSKLQVLLLFLLLFYCTIHTAAAVPCFPADAAALLQLKRSFTTTKHSVIAFRSWKAGADCCLWEGIDCGAADVRVTSLDLGDCGLKSNRLDPAIFSLTSLRYLNLANNDFNASELPSTGFERLTKLTHLNLSTCNFAGKIPASIGRLANLISLDLSTPFYVRHVADYDYQYHRNSTYPLILPNLKGLIANLRNLRGLRLDSVDMTNNEAEWCNALATYTPNIRILSLKSCRISGPICGSFSSLHSLVVLDLQFNFLSGPIPDYFANFTSLRVLQLSHNYFDGWFPSIILKQRRLATIDLSSNYDISGNLPKFSTDSSLENFLLGNTNFSGTIPYSISNLKSLKKLDLGASGFSGDLPSSIGMLKSLDFLAFSGSGLVGTIPSWIVNLTSLTVLQFSDCSLSGSIPSFIGQLTKLKKLTFSRCKFSGQIPSSISNLTQLDTLVLQSNNFEGTVELSLFWTLPNLFLLSLSNNELRVIDGEDNSSLVPFYPKINALGLASCSIDKFPKSLRHVFLNIKSLRHQGDMYGLDLSLNQIQGAIPKWAWENWSGFNFFFLNLSHNKFTNVGFEGYLPISTFTLDLSYNMFEGPIPLPQGYGPMLDYSNNISVQLENTFYFKASRNNLSGSISESFCCPKLEILDLSYNSLSGSIPSCLLEDTNALQVLNLKRNQLCGELPHKIIESCTLRALDIGDNCIEGQIPKSLAFCKNLEVLDIGNNQIGDYFPCWMSILAGLQVLVLKSNRFFGQIGHYTTEEINSCEFPSLRILDIASNNFAGSLEESWFTRLKSMIVKTANEIVTMNVYYRQVYQLATVIRYKGSEVSVSNILGILVFIDISNNAFHGSMPDAIGELVLLNVLNVSHNSLTGPIPSLLGHLTLLEALDMSSNELSGEIPQGLASLDFLAILNLSYNNLVGRIPEPNHFMTFTNSSFLGNDGLCGPPLSKECINTTTSSVVAHHSKKKSVDIVLFLFIGVGFGVGFAVTVVVTPEFRI